MTASCICTTVTGDVTALLSQSGNVAVEYYYDAFWVIIETTKMGGMVSADDNPFRYSGYFYDSETELYYLNARHYDPSIARFMQEDTYRGSINDPLSLNLYWDVIYPIERKSSLRGLYAPKGYFTVYDFDWLVFIKTLI